MLGIMRNRIFNTVTLFIALLSTSLAAPVNAYAKINEVKFAVQAEKIIEKIMKSRDKSPEKIVGYALELKKHIEKSSKIRFCIKDYLDWACDLITQKAGKPLTTAQRNYFNKMFKAKECSHNIFYIGNNDFNFDEIDLDEDIINEMGNNEKDKEEICVPSHLVWGITLTLCGLFLIATRIPVCVVWGERMVTAGVTSSATSLCSQVDKNKEKDKEQAENLPPPKNDDVDWS